MNLKDVKVSRDESAWELEVRAEIPTDLLLRYREETLKDLQKTAKLDGFREGKAPMERIVQIYGEDAILKQAVEHAIQHELPELLAKEHALIIEAPRVSIEQLESDKPVRFSAHAALAPKVELPDYRAIAREKNAQKDEISVSDEEHREAMTHLRRERARIGKIESGSEPQKAHEESRAMKEGDLPELDLPFVQSLGIESVEKFAETVRGNIKSEKELRARERRRAETLEELTNRSTIKYPARLREYELDDMEARIKQDIERAGLTWEGYLTETKKTREQLRAEWKEAADKRAKVRLVLTEIARKEKIEPEKERLEKEFENAKKHVPGAEPEALRAHIAHALRNEKVLEFLEDLK
jgi:trigger factor